MTGDSADQRKESTQKDATELVMKAEGSTVHIWVVVDGEDVYHAAPHVAMSKEAVFAAVKTFYSRAFRDHIPDLEDEDTGRLRGIFQ
jgi:hypothetical protein